MKFVDGCIQILQHKKRCEQAIVLTGAGSHQQEIIVRVVSFNETLEVILREHLGWTSRNIAAVRRLDGTLQAAGFDQLGDGLFQDVERFHLLDVALRARIYRSSSSFRISYVRIEENR